MILRNIMWHIKVVSFETFRILICYILQFKTRNMDLIFVTGTDSSHFNSCCQFIKSVTKYESKSKIIVYDLGMKKEELESMKKINEKIEIIHFDYSKYPEYFNIKVNAGEYAWKPVILKNLIDEHECFVCWMDSGNVINKRLSTIRFIIRAIGIYSPYSTGRVKDWTHIKTQIYLKSSKKVLQRKNLSGACIALNCNDCRASKIINSWRDCALEKECIAPEGSNRKNHRQDQAALSIIAHQSGATRCMPGKRYGFDVHKDVD